jgi:hypothetical protein
LIIRDTAWRQVGSYGDLAIISVRRNMAGDLGAETRALVISDTAGDGTHSSTKSSAHGTLRSLQSQHR